MPRFAVTLVRFVCAAALLAASHATAQTPATDSADAPKLTLSAEQKQTIYQSISSTQKNNAAPPGFRVAVGASVPDGIELKPMPQTLAALVPAAKDLEVAMVEKQVMLVDAKSKTVMAVITAAE